MLEMWNRGQGGGRGGRIRRGRGGKKRNPEGKSTGEGKDASPIRVEMVGIASLKITGSRNEEGQKGSEGQVRDGRMESKEGVRGQKRGRGK